MKIQINGRNQSGIDSAGSGDSPSGEGARCCRTTSMSDASNVELPGELGL